MESVTKRPNHDQCITRDVGKKKQSGADTRQWLTERSIDAMDANGFVLSSPIATKRKPCANTKDLAAMLNRLLISNPSLRMRPTKRFAIARL